MKRLLAIGECMVELAPTGDATFTIGFAGDTFNTAWYAQRLAGPDLDVAYLSAVGDDAPSEEMTAFMRNAGITPELRIRTGRSVGLYMISLKDGERSFSYWRDTSAARTLADDLENLPGLNPGDIAFFSGITLAILPDQGRHRLLDALSQARREGVTIVFDPNLRPRLWSTNGDMINWIMRAAAVSDIALPSFEDEATHFADADINATADRYGEVGVRTIIVKDGGGPVLIRTAAGDEIFRPEPVSKIVDTTAAGDSFNAGYIAARAVGDPPVEAAEAGAALAREVVGFKGAIMPRPEAAA